MLLPLCSGLKLIHSSLSYHIHTFQRAEKLPAPKAPMMPWDFLEVHALQPHSSFCLGMTGSHFCLYKDMYFQHALLVALHHLRPEHAGCCESHSRCPGFPISSRRTSGVPTSVFLVSGSSLKLFTWVAVLYITVLCIKTAHTGTNSISHRNLIERMYRH